MATIVDWALVCDLAYFDRNKRLCLSGIDAGSPLRCLSPGMHRVEFALHFRDRGEEEFEPALLIATPGGQSYLADAGRDFIVESAGDYLLIHLQTMPFREEGYYRFELLVGRSGPFVFDFHVSTAGSSGTPRRCLPTR